MTVLAAILALPIAWFAHSNIDDRSQIADLRLQNSLLELENSGYRATAAELTSDMVVLKNGITDLSSRLGEPSTEDRSIKRLPQILRIETSGFEATAFEPKKTFDILSDLLDDLGQRLQVVRHGVAFREALVDATPNIWPADGWLSSAYGNRKDPFTGKREFHAAVDISTRRGQPVYATATGMISMSSRNGAYGNMIEIMHGFGLNTRYGHLSDYAVRTGDTVRRGDLIGYAGATGRATGYHVHYEVSVNGRTINPLSLLPKIDTLSAN